MRQGAKPAKAKVEVSSAAAIKAPRNGGANAQELERRLTEALEQQEATSEILRVISASPTDVQPVLDAVAERAARLCRAPFARVLLVDGGVLLSKSDFSIDGANPIPVLPVAMKRTSITGRAVLDRATVHHADIVPLLDTEFPDARENQRRTGFRATLAVPLLREGSAYGAIFLWRREAGLFAPDQVALVQTFARQAAIAIDNVRLFKDTKEALEQQTATSEILRAISRSPSDIKPVFETIAANALRLCDATFSVCYRFDGELIHIAALHHVKPEGIASFLAAYPCPPGRGGITQRAILTGSLVHVADVCQDPEYVYHDAARNADYRSVLSVPMLRDGRPIGAITVFRDVPGLFPDTQIALLQTFADQAVIAIGNVHLFTELDARNSDLAEALEQQTATSEILRAISRSPSDIKPVLDAVVHAAARFCGAPDVAILRLDGGVLRGAAAIGQFADVLRLGAGSVDALEIPLTRGSVSGRAALEGRTIHVHDLATEREEEFPMGRELQRRFGHHTILATPLLREGVVLGVVGLFRMEVKPFSDKQVELLKTFADQAVIAIENVRLFRELETRNRDLTEALEQQTATSEILHVISESPTDVQPVFARIAAAALRLCTGNTAIVATYDGTLIHVGALANADPKGAEAIHKTFPRPPSAESATARAVQTNDVVMIPDILEDRAYTIQEYAMTAGFRSIVAVPLTREGSPIGAITVGRPEPGPFSGKEIALLQTFARQAVIAIENVRLFTELQARTTQLTRSVGELKALGEVGQAVSSTLDLETVLRTIASRAIELAGVDGGAIYEYDETRESFHLHTTDRLPAELVDALRATPIPKGEGAVGRLALAREPVEIRDIMDAGTYRSRVREILIRLGYRSLLAVPLLREDHLLGGLVVNRKSVGAFTPQVIDLLKTFATQSALAIQNARLFREIEDKGRQLEIASKHKSEFLANMSHELRTPLNAIIGFSEVLAERMFGEVNDKQAEYLADILESGRHLLGLINDILDLSKIEAGRMELEPTDFNLPGAIDNTLTLVRERAHRRGIALERTLDERVSTVRADERKVKQVILNLLSNALKFTPEGGRIDVRTDVRDGAIEISVTDTGVGIAPEDLEAVFEEFRQVGSAAKKVEGTGLGLAISRKFIELHGGRIWVTSQLGIGSTFAFTLPLTSDQRRSAG